MSLNINNRQFLLPSAKRDLTPDRQHVKVGETIEQLKQELASARKEEDLRKMAGESL